MSKNDRFQIVQEEGNGLTSNHRMVLADTTTGVQYLFVKDGYAGGLCPLVDRDGKIGRASCRERVCLYV